MSNLEIGNVKSNTVVAYDDKNTKNAEDKKELNSIFDFAQNSLESATGAVKLGVEFAKDAGAKIVSPIEIGYSIWSAVGNFIGDAVESVTNWFSGLFK